MDRKHKTAGVTLLAVVSLFLLFGTGSYVGPPADVREGVRSREELASTVECFGREASAQAKYLLTGQRVVLESDPTQGERGRYGRPLAYVYLEDGEMLNELLIRGGYAYEYTYHLPYRYQERFQAAERAAREAKAGLWADGMCEDEPVSIQAPLSAPPASFEPEQAPLPSSGFDCSQNVYNCSDFASHAEAQRAFEACIQAAGDVHGLDRDRDGLACESL